MTEQPANASTERTVAEADVLNELRWVRDGCAVILSGQSMPYAWRIHLLVKRLECALRTQVALERGPGRSTE